jgi:hypothetical protein
MRIISFSGETGKAMPCWNSSARTAFWPYDEVAAFVKLLLKAAEQGEIPIYIVITMRSDFPGDCAQFHDLPESIINSQYLIFHESLVRQWERLRA